MRTFLAILSLIGFHGAAPALAQDADPQPAAPAEPSAEAAAPVIPIHAPPEPKSLDELLEMVREGFEAEHAVNQRREAEFKQNKENQERLLNEALATLAGEEAGSQLLEVSYN